MPTAATPATRMLRYLYGASVRRLLEEYDVTDTQVEYVVAHDVRDDQAVAIDVVADIGNARTVVLVHNPRAGETVERIMPSARTLIGASSYELFSVRGLPQASWSTLSKDEHVLERDGVEVFVGQLAVDSELPASGARGSDRRYFDGTTLDFLLAGICSALPHAKKISARVATLVPIALYEQIEAKVTAALKRTHEITYNGRLVSVKITEVRVLREAQAAYAAIDGEKDGRTLIVDGGGRTINLALFDNGVYKIGRTLDNIGVEAALDALDKDLSADLSQRPLTLRERVELLHALKAGEPYSVVMRNERTNIDGRARAQMHAVARAAVAEMYAKVKVEAAEHIYVIGGGAYDGFFGAVWRDQLDDGKHLEFTKKPELMNAYGALLELNSTAKRPRTRK